MLRTDRKLSITAVKGETELKPVCGGATCWGLFKNQQDLSFCHT